MRIRIRRKGTRSIKFPWEGDITVKGKIGGATVTGDGYTELLPSGF
jgi:hypothetical protein